MSEDKRKDGSDLSRRDLMRTAGVAGLAGTGMLFGAVSSATAKSDKGKGQGNSPSSDGSDSTGATRLVNGKFVDWRGEVASSLFIKDGRIAEVGGGGEGPAETINLHGATVIPGFINGHIHHSRTGTNAGREARDIETAFSVLEVQEVLARRLTTVPAGEWTGCHLGWHYVQLAENRPPTKAELDDAAPDNPVFLSGRAGHVEPFFSVTNTLGQQFFESQGFAVDDDTGQILGGATPEQAFNAIRNLETPEDRLRQTYDNNKWAASNGMTQVLDPAGSANTAQEYPAVELWRRGMLDVRHRLYRSAGSVEQVETRVQNTFRHMGDDWLREGGFGETIGSRTNTQLFQDVTQAVAEAGWKGQHHTDFFSDVDRYISAFQAITVPLDPIRFQLIHFFQVTDEQLETLKGLGVGVDLELERYLDRLERGGGPFFRLILDSGINIGFGNDGSNFAPNNPWLMMYYATTGVSVTGAPNNTDQTITRMEALTQFTKGSAFQSFDDDKMGAFDVGKYADLAVLSDDFRTVTDADLRKIKSVLTMVGGKIVHRGPEIEYAPIGMEFEYITGP